MPLRRPLSVVASLTVLAGLPTLASPASADTDPTSTVFINEIHYDNDGTDTGELVEVAGPAGTDLTGWSVVLYNGTNGARYTTRPLSGPLTDQGGGHGTARYEISGIQNGSPDGVALVDPTGAVTQLLSYEGTFTAVDGPAEGLASTDIGVAESSATPVGHSLQLTGTGSTYGDFTWSGPSAGSPGGINTGQTFGSGRGAGGDGGHPDGPEEPEAPETVLVSEVQGAGPTSPLAGQLVAVEGVVTSLLERGDVLDGFFLQEEDADADADAGSSEGVLVFCRGACPDALAEGDLVRATGQVDESSGMTQVEVGAPGGGTEVVSRGHPLPTPVPVELPADGSTEAEGTFESVEGMVGTFPGALVVSEYFELARYGQLVLTADERPYQFTHASEPSVEGYEAFRADLATRRIVLDDDNNDQNDAISGPDADEPYPYPEPGLSTEQYVRGGDTVEDLTGVLHWSSAGRTGTDAWRVRPIASEDYVFQRTDPRPASPEDVGGNLTVASSNVLNYFTTIDETSSSSSGPCGPSGAMDCRGADSQAELERQRAKTVASLLEIDADVAGLIEIQNDAGQSTRDLVDALNAVAGAGTYAAVETGTIGTDAITVALVYRPASVTPVGDPAVLDSSVDPRFEDDRNRPALAQTFAEVATGERFTVAVNHLKSKGSSCGEEGPDDGAGNCDEVRTQAARALADWLAGDPTGSGDPDTLIIGDLNSYRMERPIQALETAGYVDLLERFEGDDAYTYVFDGQLGYLDYALADADLLPQVTGATAWHTNADEVPLLDYNDTVRSTGEASFDRESDALPLYAPDPYRASDHDAVVVGLDLDAPNRAPVADAGGPYEVRVGRLTTLDASGSSDADSDQLSYSWDLDGDGQFDDAAGPRPELAGRGRAPGEHVVSVQVTDGTETATDQATVRVVTPGRGNGGVPPGRP